MDHKGTYSPEDNKLRLYPAYRLDKDEYNRLKAAGFKWAPRQELFVAPMWTPGREDILAEFCGEIGDEDTSLVDRAEERSERFETYSENRLKDAHNAKAAVAAIADNIPLGQPILVGHHSEKHARKHAEKIENGMRKAVKMWETSKYWEQRASGALRHAKYKERPEVRARRIKGIEADKRKAEKEMRRCRDLLNFWLSPGPLSKTRALAIANFAHYSQCFPLDKYPRELPASQYEGSMSLWSALDQGIITARQARNLHVPALERGIARHERWLTHYNNRLSYEKAMLDDQGASDLIAPKARPKQLPLLNYRAPEGLTITNPDYYAEKKSHWPQAEMTKDQYKAIGQGAFIRPVDRTHRVRCCSARNVPGALDGLTGIDRTNAAYRTYCVFLTDSKVHEKPAPAEVVKVEKPVTLGHVGTVYQRPERTEFDDIKDVLRNGGVKAVSAHQLFVTPKEIVDRMILEADIEPGMTVLEPSAGTGSIAQAIPKGCHLDCIEINNDLCKVLRSKGFEVTQYDFFEARHPLCPESENGFHRIIMNPPFENGADIKHIEHALKFLRVGGRLVALCANGPRQQSKLKPIAEESGGWWEELPAGSFKEAGTNVNVAMLVIEG